MSIPSSVSVKSDLDTEWYSNKKIDDVFAHELRDQKDVVALPAIPTEGSDYFNPNPSLEKILPLKTFRFLSLTTAQKSSQNVLVFGSW